MANLTANPAKIDERLAEAAKALEAATAEHQKRMAAYTAAAKAHADADAQLKAKQTNLAADMAKAKETAAQLTDVTGKLKAEQEKLAATTANSTKLGNAVPLLAESLAQANKAIAAAGDDKELKDVAAKLKAVHDKRHAELEAAKKTMVSLKATVDTLVQTQTTYAEAAKKLEQSTVALKAEVDAMAKTLPALKTAADQAKAVVDEQQPQLVAAQQAHQRWQDEKAFSVKIAELLAKQSEVLTLVATRAQQHADMQAAAEAVAAEMKSAQEKMEAATKAAEAAAAELTTLKAEQDKATNDLAAAQTAEQTHVANAKTLETAVASLVAAGKALDGQEDEQLKAIAQTIATTIAAKQEQQKKEVVAAEAQKVAAAKYQTLIAELGEKQKVATAKAAEMKETLAAAESAMKQAAEKQGKAVQQVEAAQQQLQGAESQLTEINKQIGEMRQRQS